MRKSAMPARKPAAAQDRKITRYATYDVTHIADLIACLSANVEDAYRTAGVTDYTAKDCVDLVAREVVRGFLHDSALVKQASIHTDTL